MRHVFPTFLLVCTFGQASYPQPAWLSNKDRISFTYQGKHGSEDVFLMDEDGQNISLLIQTGGDEFYPFFSKKSRNLITLINDLGGEREVYTFHLKEGTITQLTDKGKVLNK